MLGGLALVPVALLVLAGPMSGQVVEFRQGSGGMARADEALERVLERGRYRVFSRDTVLGADAVVAGDIVLIEATLRVEGRIEGDLLAVRSDVFARPGGRIDGTVVVMGGGFYGSSLAELGASPIDGSTFAYMVEERDDGTYVITAPGGRAKVELAGLWGLMLPLYDRVNALTVPVGVDLDGGGSKWLPDAELRLRYRSAREKLDGDLELSWSFGRHAVLLGGGRTVKSNDRWINGDMENSLYAFVGAVDTRNYYDAYFVDAGVRLGFGATAAWIHDITLAWERARSLENRDPFSLFDARGAGFQDNLPVSEQDIVSLALASTVEVWGNARSSITAELNFELADEKLAGDRSFTVLGGALRARIGTIGEQTLALEGRVQAPLSDTAPPQRWRALGGWGSLPTVLPTGRVGDRMWWAAATYRAPFGPSVGRLGRVVPWLQYATGNAWSEAEPRPSTVHNIGLGLSLGPLAAGVYSAPSDDFETVLVMGLDTRR